MSRTVSRPFQIANVGEVEQVSRDNVRDLFFHGRHGAVSIASF
jgi:hypothetical protein